MGNFGEFIEQYDVFELLGTGGFASVHRARCRKSGVEVAIKKIERKRIKAAGMAGRVNQEVAIHSRLKHPSVLQLHTFFEDETYVYLVLDLCHNGELQRYLKTAGVLSEPEACNIMKQIVEGVLYLHSHQIIHRDITLANMLLTKDMNVKIADFGLATQLKRPDEKHRTMCGTPNYISPEVATRASHGLETDVWGLGILLYTCLVGKPPFDTDDGLKSTLTLVVLSEIKFPPHVSVEAQDLIKSLLQKNPKERIKLKKILEHPFIIKWHSSLNGPLQRCMSYDSGVATASYLTAPPYNSYSHGVFQGGQTASKSGSFQNCRPISPNSRKFSYANHHNNPPPSYNGEGVYNNFNGNRPHDFPPPPENCTGCSRQNSHHQCPSSMGNPSFASQNYRTESEIGLSLIPNRFVPFGASSSSSVQNVVQPQTHCSSSIVSKHSVCADSASCSHAWKQCQQCSHVDSCGCMTKLQQQPSYCSTTGPKFEDNHYSSNHQQNSLAHTSRNSNNYNNNERHSHNERIERRGSSAGHNTDKLNSKLPVSPINSKRLRPVRQKTKNVIVSILSSGEVCLEFIKHREGQDRVWEVMRISADGMLVVLYHPKKGKGVSISDSPPPPPTTGADAIYNYENVPEKHWKKYMYAHKFVDLVKSKTPKITYYSQNAKCFLMENLPVPDFEACFYQGGKITKSQSRVTVTEFSGKSFCFDFYDDHPSFTTDVQFMWEHFKKCRDHCLTLNKCMSDLNTEETVFPVIIGRRPQSQNQVL